MPVIGMTSWRRSRDCQRIHAARAAGGASPTPEVARALRAMLHELEGVSIDAATATWLEEAPRWIAQIDIEKSGDEPILRFTTRWGSPLRGRRLERVRASVPMRRRSPRERRRRRGLEHEPEITLSTAAERAFEWWRQHPHAQEIPAAELDVAETSDGAWLEVEPIWDTEPEAAFVQQEMLLCRGSRPHGSTPPDNSLAAVGDRTLPATLARQLHARGGPAGRRGDEHRQRGRAAAGHVERGGRGPGGCRARQGAHAIPARRRRLRAEAPARLRRRRAGPRQDDPGAGSVQADLAYPAVVVCPASLKLNWLREIEKWLPDRTTRQLSGRAHQPLDGEDLVVLNYEIVANHIEELAAIGPRALILDESHYVKSPRPRGRRRCRSCRRTSRPTRCGWR